MKTGKEKETEEHSIGYGSVATDSVLVRWAHRDKNSVFVFVFQFGIESTEKYLKELTA